MWSQLTNLVLDATGKMKPGFIAGEYGDFGNYDQCLDIEVDNGQQFPKSDSNLVTGQHCLYKMHFPLPLRHEDPVAINLVNTPMDKSWLTKIASVYKFLYASPMVNGLCMPSMCDKEEIQEAIRFCEWLAVLLTKFTNRVLNPVLEEADVPAKFEFYEECDVKSNYGIKFEDYPLYKRLSM